MAFFDFWTESIAIDLGTANTLIIHNDKVVVDSPSIVAIDKKTDKIIAVGAEASLMQGKTHENIKTVRPLKDGVIADFNASEQMISLLISSIPSLKKRFFTPALKMVICIPSGITEVEMRAVRESAERVNGKEVYLIHEPMAAAIGIGVDIMQPKGNMIVDIGGGTTEIAVIALSGIVCDKSVKVAGDVFTGDIIYYMRTQHNLFIGERTAEKIKITIGSASEELESPPDDISVQGRDLLTGKPKEALISYREIAKALDKSIIRSLLKISIPFALTGIFARLNTQIDTVFLSKLGCNSSLSIMYPSLLKRPVQPNVLLPLIKILSCRWFSKGL